MIRDFLKESESADGYYQDKLQKIANETAVKYS